MKIKNVAIASHRNGVAGNSFYIVLFTWKDTEARKTRNMVATVFRDKGNVAVLDVGETAVSNIAFGEGNSWRGDDFEPALRQVIAAYETEGYQP